MQRCHSLYSTFLLLLCCLFEYDLFGQVSNAASVPSNKAPLAPPRNKANREENATLGDRNAASAAAGGGDGSGGGGGAAKGFTVARGRDARSGGESGCVGGSGGSGTSGKYSAQRKRVRVVNDKLGEFVVMLQPYKGGEFSAITSVKPC